MAGLGDYPVAGVLRAENLARAEKFYTEVLGLKKTQALEGMLEAGDGTTIIVYERPGLPAPENTALGFGVPADKFDELLADLKSKGVVLEDYDIPEMGLKTVNGIAEFDGSRAVWFKDSEGNIINVATM